VVINVNARVVPPSEGTEWRDCMLSMTLTATVTSYKTSISSRTATVRFGDSAGTRRALHYCSAASGEACSVPAVVSLRTSAPVFPSIHSQPSRSRVIHVVRATLSTLYVSTFLSPANDVNPQERLLRGLTGHSVVQRTTLNVNRTPAYSPA
jgi:hypothetical protein